MTQLQVELAQIDLPEFGSPTTDPQIEETEYESRLQSLWSKAAERNIDVLLVYGDREHSANLAFLTGFDPRFEEALLILPGTEQPKLLVGNEDWGYSESSKVELDRHLYQPFSLLGQDRSRSELLANILNVAGIQEGVSVGMIDWKYFGSEAGQNPDLWINAPSYLVDTIREITGQAPSNVTDILMNPQDGLRVINSVDQLASFEFAASCISDCMKRVLWGLELGVSEFEAFEKAQLNGLPLSCHPMLSSGPNTSLGLASPSSRTIQMGDPFVCALGVWGALYCRAGFLVHDESELPSEIHDYLDRLVKPYFTAIVDWYQHVGIGVAGGDLYDIVHSHIGDPFYGVSLNPGHLIHLDEWVHSPIYSNSNVKLRSGMALQVDVIPATGGPYFTTNIEDGIALADEDLRKSFANRWPEAWARIQARRTFMQDKLNIQLKPEVLPFSNLAAFLPPYLLNLNKAMRAVG